MFRFYLFTQISYIYMNRFRKSSHFSFQFGQFASDLGGVVGLWVGASVITCFEYIEYMLDILVLWISKSKSKKTKPIHDNVFSENNATSNKGMISAFENKS